MTKKQKFLFLFLGMFLGIFMFVLTRFLFIKQQHIHYHANFLMLIDGKRVEFTDNKYMEDVTACYATGQLQPRQRVHLHENNQDVIHVHDQSVTWGQLLMNLGYNVGENYLVNDKDQIFKSEGNNKLTFIINGQEVGSIHNRIINSKDKLLISYGNTDSNKLLNESFNLVSNSAGEFNSKHDPASCSGSGKLSLKDRFLKALW